MSKSRQINKDHYFFSLLRFVVKLIQLFQLRKHEIWEYVKMEFNDEFLKTNSLSGKEFAVFFKYQTMLEMECNRKQFFDAMRWKKNQYISIGTIWDIKRCHCKVHHIHHLLCFIFWSKKTCFCLHSNAINNVFQIGFPWA